MTKLELQENFRNRFHKEPTHFFFCPGRVNLIGEHIDYNGGKVVFMIVLIQIKFAMIIECDKRSAVPIALNYIVGIEI
jgi:galactokinase